ncbi:MAG: class I SAM-dependent methyltransferase [Clostridia bacterium]|nr:class I SAM-dependent methyltransferase [Clostridia bacterium]
MLNEIEQYYNKFNEDKRLLSRHGRVEFYVTYTYIQRHLSAVLDERKCAKSDIKIMDIGAGTGAYCIPLAEEGYTVSAVEMVKHNLGILKKKTTLVDARQGNACNMKKYADDTFDVTLLFGPMYHLFSNEDKIKALSEAKRITKPGGVIFVAYVMNEYGVITYCFKERHIREIMENHRLTEDFHTVSQVENLYDYVRIEDIDKLNQQCGLKRQMIISPDGAADYMRQYLNKLDEEEFQYFLDYQLSICERQDLIGAGAHTVDILIK